MNKKFELIKNDYISLDDYTLYRIRALIDFYDVSAGDLGGYIEKEANLSQEGNAWVYDNARVFGDAKICSDAKVRDNAWVYDDAIICGQAIVRSCVHDNAKVYGNACVFGNAIICGDAVIAERGDYIVFKNSWSSGRYFTYTKSNKMWRVGCFYGTGEELVKKAYADSEKSGKRYELYVNLVREMELMENETD